MLALGLCPVWCIEGYLSGRWGEGIMARLFLTLGREVARGWGTVGIRDVPVHRTLQDRCASAPGAGFHLQVVALIRPTCC